MKLNSNDSVKGYLVSAAIIKSSDEPLIEKLGGGVSSLVWKITFKDNRWVIKQALEKLDVKDDWFSDPERIHREHEVMELLLELLPNGAIPKILHTDYTNHIYVMTSADEEARTWKDILMEGEFNHYVAEKAGNFLRTIHKSGNRIAQESQVTFADQKYFIQLRVDPFHRWLIKRYPELSFSIQKLIDELTIQKICLVHGDYSPKNMLVDKDDNIVLIDFEVAHWGNPVFDVAYCIGHLMLKGWHMERQRASLKLIEVFLVKYATEVKNIIPHLGLMLLARIDGKSPVNYIREENLKNIIRKVGMDWIQEKIDYSNPLENIEFAFQTR